MITSAWRPALDLPLLAAIAEVLTSHWRGQAQNLVLPEQLCAFLWHLSS